VSGKRRDLTPEERALWRRVSEGVREQQSAPEPYAKPPPGSTRAPKRGGARDVSSSPLLPPAKRDAEKRIRRGRLEIGATLDLHGHTRETARAALATFLRAAQARGDRAVVVVTGVGRGGEGVLKRCLPDWLAEKYIRPLVSGFAQAHRTHGGAGAFYVLLKHPGSMLP
jgi:DNA-nicking Smr family endonuclease